MLRITLICVLALAAHVYGAELKEAFAWKEMDYNWPSAEFKEDALKTGSYIPENNLPLGLGIWKDKLFVTVPRWKTGVASALNYIKIDSEKTAKLTPYPSWKANYIPADKQKVSLGKLEDNSTIVSVFRVWVDKCDRLWVMDNGVADVLGDRKAVVKPSLVIFDLNTDTLVRRYFLKDSDIKENSFLANVVVDVEPQRCENAYAYMPDLGGYGVIVYSLKDNDSWRVNHHYFHFDPLAGQYNVGGIRFEWTDGVFSLALSKSDSNGERRVFFHAFSSTKEFEVSNKVLQNETWATSHDNFHDFKLLGDRGQNSQSSTNYLDEKTGVLFYTQVNRDGVACWNSAKPMNPDNTDLVVSSAEALEFPNDLTVADGTLWILSDKLPRFIYQSLDSNRVNYRIMKIPVDDAIRGTICA